MLLTWHNLHYYQDVMRGLRAAIAQGNVDEFAGQALALEQVGDIDPV